MTAPSITEFLLARIADDETAPSEPDEYLEGFCDFNDGTHYSGDRIVAECAAKRKIVQLHFECRWFGGRMGCSICRTLSTTPDEFPCTTIRLLATVYKDHPDYQRKWAL